MLWGGLVVAVWDELMLHRAGNGSAAAMKIYDAVKGSQGSLQDGAHVEFVVQALTSLGVEVSVQHFNSSDGVLCHNIHGILYSAKGDGKEAMVLATPLALQNGESYLVCAVVL